MAQRKFKFSGQYSPSFAQFSAISICRGADSRAATEDRSTRMTEKQIDEATERLLTQPKVVEVDGQRVENQSVGDLVKAAQFLASKNAMKGRKLPIRITKMASGGGIL